MTRRLQVQILSATNRIKHLARLTRSGFLFSGFHVGGGVPWRLWLGVPPFRSSERYVDFVQAISDPAHPEHEELLEWCGGTFDPFAFNLDAINAQLRRIKL